jgi:hypothetical protein
MVELIIVIIVVGVIGFYIYQKLMRDVPNNTNNNGQTETRLEEITETGSMVYFANDKHGQADKEYRFNYKKINGGWRAYILKMPDLQSRDAKSIPTHRLWDENHNPYICWKGKVTSLKDMQNISRVWADSIQQYIATGTRFGPE